MNVIEVNDRRGADRADLKVPHLQRLSQSESEHKNGVPIGYERELVLKALLDERELPESCVDYRGDSTGIIKPDGAEWDFGSTDDC